MLFRLLCKVLWVGRSRSAAGSLLEGDERRRAQGILVWTGAAGVGASDWSNPGNWDLGRAPLPVGDAKFDRANLHDRTGDQPVDGGKKVQA